MKKSLLALLVTFICACPAYAQRYLSSTDETDINETFNSQSDAGVIIRVKSDLALRGFKSNMDREVSLDQKQVDDENNETYYCLIFSPGKRTLSIDLDGYYVYDLNLDIDPGRMYRYNIFDPNESATNSYFNKNISEGQNFFDSGDYHSAREKFMRAYNWSEATESDKTEARRLVDNCDSLLYHRKMGFNYADMMRYEDAIQHLNAAMRLNPRDHQINDLLTECYSESNGLCDHYLAQGDEFMKLKEYAEAIAMYQKVIDRNCDNAAIALMNRSEAQQMLNKRNIYGSYFGIEIGHLKGFTTGSYKKHSGGYFSLRTNTELFDLLSRKYDLDKHPELNLSFGWTIPVYTKQHWHFLGAWLHAGLGISSAVIYGLNDDTTDNYMRSNLWKSLNLPTNTEAVTQANLDHFISEYNQTVNTDNTIRINDMLSPGFGFAITPELGLGVKVWHFMARLSWQYNFTLNQDYEKVFGKSRLYFGIGYCW